MPIPKRPVPAEPVAPPASPPRASGPPPAVSGLVATSSPPPVVVPPATDVPPPRSRGPWLAVIGGVLIAAIAVVAVTLGSSSPEAASEAAAGEPSECPELEALAGSWVFTTLTTGARRKKRLGMRHYYELEVHVSGCEATADLTNIGRQGAETYDEERKQRASATLARGEGAHAFGFGARFEPRNAAGQGIPKELVFAVEGEHLVGTWRELDEHWERSGQFGVIEGHRSGDPRAWRPRRRTMPCEIQCAVPKTIEEADAEPDSAALQACLAACE